MSEELSEEEKARLAAEEAERSAAGGEGAAGGDGADAQAAADGAAAGANGAATEEEEDVDFESDPDYAPFVRKPAGGEQGNGVDNVTVPRDEFKSLNDDATAYRGLKANPAALAAVMHFANGGTLEQLLGSVDTTDYAKKSVEELYLLDVTMRMGELTAEEREEALEELGGMSSFKRKEIKTSLAEKFNSTKSQKSSELVNQIKAHQEAIAQEQGRIMEEFKKTVLHWVNKGKFFDMPFDEHKAKEVLKEVETYGWLGLFMTDGKPDARKMFQAAAGSLYMPQIARAKKAAGAKKAVEEMSAAIHNTGTGSSASAGSSGVGAPDAKAPGLSPYEKHRKAEAERKRKAATQS
jgi:hypothetical protein